MDSPEAKRLFEENDKDSIIDAEYYIINEFPKKILEIKKVLQYPELSIHGTVDAQYGIDPAVVVSIQQSANSSIEGGENASATSLNGTVKKIPRNNIMIAAHKGIIELTEYIKPFFHELDTDICIVKMWLASLMPKFEAGDNFGTFVQEFILNLVKHVENLNALFYDRLTSYSEFRADILTRLMKYPFVEDYQRAIEFEDEKQFLYLGYSLNEVLNSYVIINNIIVKNLEKIKKPKSDSENYH